MNNNVILVANVYADFIVKGRAMDPVFQSGKSLKIFRVDNFFKNLEEWQILIS